MEPVEEATSGFDPTAVDLRDYVDFRESGPAGRRVFSTDVLAVDMLGVEPGQVIDARTFATADAIYTVLGGRAWVVTDDAEVTLAPLQSVMVPAGIAHGVRNDAADPLILQIVVSPPDEAPPLPAGPAEQPEAGAERSSKTPLSQRVRRMLGG